MDLRGQGFRLEGLRIEPPTGEVAGPGGREQLDPKVMAVLVTLAGRAGRVVTREELLSQVWPGAVVSDDALTRCIYELRRHLSQAGGDERYKAMLDTLPKRGYRLNVTVSPPEEAGTKPAPPAARPRWPVAGALLVAGAVAAVAWWGIREKAPAPPNSIAVLPFADMSAEGDQRYFSDGISEEILNRLVQSSDLRVISRTSSFTFRDADADIPEIAEKLDVSHVLEGSVRRSGDRVRITAQLISAATNAHVWSDTYDRSLGDIFSVQDDIAAEVAAALDASLSGTQAPRPPPPKPEAYERYLQGRFFYDRRAPGDLELMKQYLEEAVEIDPRFARAWAELAGAYRLLVFEHPDGAATWHPKHGAAARQAVELDPGLPAAHLRLAQYYWMSEDAARGNAHFDRAQELDPNNVLLLSVSAGQALKEGDRELGLEFQRRALARDPLSAVQHKNMSFYLGATGQYEEALAELRVAEDLGSTMAPVDYAERVRLLVLLGRLDQAPEVVPQIPEGDFRDFALALLYQAPGREAEADAALQRLADRPPNTEEPLLAEAYAQRGMTDLAFESLWRIREAFPRDDIPDRNQAYGLQQKLFGSPLLRPMESDPRWKAFLADLDGSPRL
jgi:TolB-like protein/DNA-binding winged helix-turn-helix (wHTH) protein/tetratricopeptide (TPR) repeat protein